MRIGLISDTHGLLRPEAAAALANVDHIVHAGDIGNPRVLEQLEEIAAVTAVRGNNDTGEWARRLRDSEVLDVHSTRFFVIHDLNDLVPHRPPAGVRVVVSGHSHRAVVTENEGVLYVNPGSAGPRRFRLPVTVALLTIEGADVSVRLIDVLAPPFPS